MIIGILKEINRGENRVVLRPKEVAALVHHKHEVLVEKDAGKGSHYSDEAYTKAGAKIVATDDIYKKAEMIVKLRSPTDAEFKKIKDKILFSMLHTNQNPKRVKFIKENGISALEMESVKNDQGERYVDATDITGEIGVLYATQFLKKIPSDTRVLVLGYGRVGSAAIGMCNKLNMRVKILRKSEYKDIEHFMKGRDILINAISWPEEERKKKNYLITKDMLKLLNKGAVILDLSVDYPNPIETCKPTTLVKPWFTKEGVVHISIYGYPGLAPLSSVNRYSKQALPLIVAIADNGGFTDLDKKHGLGKDILNATILAD
jgi:alanine dehydrogenase